MATKIISIIYNELAKLKLPKESFSEEINRIIKVKGKITECAGLWSNHMKKEDIECIELNIKKRRELSMKAKSFLF